MKSGVIHVKAAIKAWSRAVQRIENQRADECSRAIPMLMQDVRQIGKTRRKGDAEVVHMIVLRIGSREDARVRRSRKRHMRVSTGEHDTLLRHCIQIGSKPPGRAEKPHAVGTGSIERDDDDIGMENCACSRKRQGTEEKREESHPGAPTRHKEGSLP